jgi:hypothetical protein
MGTKRFLNTNASCISPWAVRRHVETSEPGKQIHTCDTDRQIDSLANAGNALQHMRLTIRQVEKPKAHSQKPHAKLKIDHHQPILVNNSSPTGSNQHKHPQYRKTLTHDSVEYKPNRMYCSVAERIAKAHG